MSGKVATTFVLAATLLVLLAAACGGGDGRTRVTVAAASDLRFAFEALEEPFEDQCGCDLVFSFGSSGLLAEQIARGLPVDVFASADSGYVDRLEEQGLLADGTVQAYALGRVVLAISVQSTLQADELEELARPEFRSISIANPEHAPYGRAAKEALESAGIWEAVEDRLVLGENASLATQFVEFANVDAGIVPLSLAVQRGERLRYVLLDESLHEPLRQVAAVLRSSDHPDLAVAFLDFINGPEGRPVMESFGFVLPSEAMEP